MDELTLINECIKGNSLAQKKLFEKFAPKMMFVCLRYCKDSADAEDVLQEGFIKVFTYLPKYKHEGSFEGWMRRVFVNTCLDFLRKEKQLSTTSSFEDVDYKITDDSLSSDNLEVEDLMKIISKLPKGYQIVFSLFAIEGYSHKEIAELLGISEDTSKSQYFRARTSLKSYLEKIDIR
ncbi:MAG: sigma-70 family RNA polymerase sigma factor [Bacteroidota bacterium]